MNSAMEQQKKKKNATILNTNAAAVPNGPYILKVLPQKVDLALTPNPKQNLLGTCTTITLFLK